MARKLTRAQRRALNARLDAPFVPGSPLTYRDVARERNAAQTLRYGPTESLLNQRQQNTGAWFDQYKADLAAKAARTQATYGQAVQGITDQSAASQQAADALRAKLDAEARSDAEKRGAVYSGTPGVQAQSGANIQKAMADAFASALAGQGASYQAYTADQSAVGSAAQLSERLKTAKAIEELAKDKSVYGEDYIAKRRGEERQSVLENIAFKIKAETAEQTAAAKSLKTNRWGYTDAEWAGKSEAERTAIRKEAATYGKTPKAPPKPKLSEEGRKVKATIRKAVRAVQRNDNGLDTFWDTAYNTLIDKDGLDPVVARAVVQGARLGRIGKKTAKALLEDYGIDPDTLDFGKPRNRPVPYQQQVPSQAKGPSGQLRPT